LKLTILVSHAPPRYGPRVRGRMVEGVGLPLSLSWRNKALIEFLQSAVDAIEAGIQRFEEIVYEVKIRQRDS
jgi:hypothetical protein